MSSSRFLTWNTIYMLMIPNYFISIPDLFLIWVSFIQLPRWKPKSWFCAFPLIFIPHFSEWQFHSFCLSGHKLQRHPWFLSSSCFHIPNGSKSYWLHCQFLSSVQPLLSPSTTTWSEPLLSPAWMTATTPNCFCPCSLAVDSHHHRPRGLFNTLIRLCSSFAQSLKW